MKWSVLYEKKLPVDKLKTRVLLCSRLKNEAHFKAESKTSEYGN